MGWVVLNNAARVGANYAGLHADGWDTADLAAYTSLVTDARDDAASALSGCDTEVVPPPSFPNGTELGDFAEVVLDCDFRPLTPIIGDVFASTGHAFGVSARSVFPIRTGLLAGAPPPPPPDSCLASFTWSPNNPVAGDAVSFTDSTSAPAAQLDVDVRRRWCCRQHWDPLAHLHGRWYLHRADERHQQRHTMHPVRSGDHGGCGASPASSAPPDTCLSYFTWSPVNPIVGEVVSFTDGTPPTASNWNWTFGDGATADIRNPSHPYASAGTYAVELRSDSEGKACTPHLANIIVSPPPSSTCQVPGFSGTWHYDAQKAWKDAGFTTTVDLAPGDKQNQNWIILWQSLIGGQPVPCNASVTISASQPKKP